MHRTYANALLALLATGTPLETALAGLTQTLKAKRAMKLYPRVLEEALRLLESAERKTAPTLTHAGTTPSEADVSKARALLGLAPDVSLKTAVDPSLIGGFTLTATHKEVDHSYKRSLITLYESITR